MVDRLTHWAYLINMNGKSYLSIGDPQMERTIANFITMVALDICRGSLFTSKEMVFLHQSAVHFSTDIAVQFSPDIYRLYYE